MNNNIKKLQKKIDKHMHLCRVQYSKLSQTNKENKLLLNELNYKQKLCGYSLSNGKEMGEDVLLLIVNIMGSNTATDPYFLLNTVISVERIIEKNLEPFQIIFSCIKDKNIQKLFSLFQKHDLLYVTSRRGKEEYCLRGWKEGRLYVPFVQDLYQSLSNRSKPEDYFIANFRKKIKQYGLKVDYDSVNPYILLPELEDFYKDQIETGRAL